MRLSIYSATLIALSLVTAQDATTEVQKPIFICPLPRCGKCPSQERRATPGVGFALEMGHGTASIKYNNGSFKQVAHISGSSEYKILMQHLATSPIKRMTHGERPPPGVDEKDRRTILVWIWFHSKRYLNKILRRPADPRFSALAEMAWQLQQDVEKHLGQRIKAAAISSPDRVRLTRFEINDIFDYLWIEDLVKDKKGSPSLSQLFSMAAASAGYSQGLCSNYTNSYECYNEEQLAPNRRTLQLDFSSYSLSGAIADVKSARRGPSSLTFIDPSLGYSYTPQAPNEAEKYWKRIAAQIREFSGTVPLQTLLLTGENASEPRFIEAVKDALSYTAPDQAALALDLKESLGEKAKHFLFATSMGAAEFAKRRQEGMAHCLLPPECRENHTGSQHREHPPDEL